MPSAAVEPVAVECGAVVGAVGESDAFVCDRAAPGWQQFDPVGSGQGDGYVPGDTDEHTPHLVGSERQAGHERVPQPLVAPFLPPADDPFV